MARAPKFVYHGGETKRPRAVWDRSHFGECLRLIRESAGWTQEMVATALGVGGVWVCRVEKGNRKMSEALMKKFEKEFRLPPGSLSALWVGGDQAARDFRFAIWKAISGHLTVRRPA